jgi:hypothetical protein
MSIPLFGQALDRTQLRRRLASISTACGVRLMTLADGPERGVRMLEFRAGSGLRFTVLVDRGMDVGDLEWRGVPLAWQSAAGYRSSALNDAESEGGLGLMRSFTGFMLTCGFDHVRRPDRETAAHYGSPMRSEILHPLHGRGALTPARLVGYGADWTADGDLLLWCEGEVRQAFLYSEHYVLRRRIEVMAGSSRFIVSDRLVNEASMAAPHMLLYHLNLGWPLLDEGSEFLAPVAETVWSSVPRASQSVGCWQQAGPQPGGGQQVFVHRVVADRAGTIDTALVNRRLGVGVRIGWPKSQLPWMQQWQCLAEGTYAFGIEPVTNRFGTRSELMEQGEIAWMQSGEERRYDLAVEVLDGNDAIGACEHAIRQLAPIQPECPSRSGAIHP